MPPRVLVLLLLLLLFSAHLADCYISCNANTCPYANDDCGDSCFCYLSDQGGICGINELCASASTCNQNSDCPAGQVCGQYNCCGYAVCIPECTSLTTSSTLCQVPNCDSCSSSSLFQCDTCSPGFEDPPNNCAYNTYQCNACEGNAEAVNQLVEEGFDAKSTLECTVGNKFFSACVEVGGNAALEVAATGFITPASLPGYAALAGSLAFGYASYYLCKNVITDVKGLVDYTVEKGTTFVLDNICQAKGVCPKTGIVASISNAYSYLTSLLRKKRSGPASVIWPGIYTTNVVLYLNGQRTNVTTYISADVATQQQVTITNGHLVFYQCNLDMVYTAAAGGNGGGGGNCSAFTNVTLCLVPINPIETLLDDLFNGTQTIVPVGNNTWDVGTLQGNTSTTLRLIQSDNGTPLSITLYTDGFEYISYHFENFSTNFVQPSINTAECVVVPWSSVGIPLVTVQPSTPPAQPPTPSTPSTPPSPPTPSASTPSQCQAGNGQRTVINLNFGGMFDGLR